MMFRSSLALLLFMASLLAADVVYADNSCRQVFADIVNSQNETAPATDLPLENLKILLKDKTLSEEQIRAAGLEFLTHTQKQLEGMGLQTTIIESAGRPVLKILPDGNAKLAKIAKRISERFGYSLIYNPIRNIQNNSRGYAGRSEKVIGLSHDTIKDGTPDSTFIHEVKHTYLNFLREKALESGLGEVLLGAYFSSKTGDLSVSGYKTYFRLDEMTSMTSDMFLDAPSVPRLHDVEKVDSIASQLYRLTKNLEMAEVSPKKFHVWRRHKDNDLEKIFLYSVSTSTKGIEKQGIKVQMHSENGKDYLRVIVYNPAFITNTKTGKTGNINFEFGIFDPKIVESFKADIRDLLSKSNAPSDPTKNALVNAAPEYFEGFSSSIVAINKIISAYRKSAVTVMHHTTNLKYALDKEDAVAFEKERSALRALLLGLYYPKKVNDL